MKNITSENIEEVLAGLTELSRVNLNFSDTIDLIEDNYDYYDIWNKYFSDNLYTILSEKFGMSLMDFKIKIINLLDEGASIDDHAIFFNLLEELDKNFLVRLKSNIKYKDEELKDTVYDFSSFLVEGRNLHEYMFDDEDEDKVEESLYFQRIGNVVDMEAIYINDDHNMYINIDAELVDKTIGECGAIVIFYKKESEINKSDLEKLIDHIKKMSSQYDNEFIEYIK